MQKDSIIQFRIQPLTKQRAESIAEWRDETLSQICRRAINEYIRQHYREYVAKNQSNDPVKQPNGRKRKISKI